MRTPSIADLFVAVLGDKPGNRPARPKERLDEYDDHSVEHHARVLATRRQRFSDQRQRSSRDPALLLVGAARIVGEPFDLYRAAGRRRPDPVRLRDQHVHLPHKMRAASALDPMK